jgi:hypothetical protein
LIAKPDDSANTSGNLTPSDLIAGSNGFDDFPGDHLSHFVAAHLIFGHAGARQGWQGAAERP